MRNYYIRLLFLTIAILAVSAIVFTTVLSQYFLNIMPFVLLFFVVLSTVLHKILVKANEKKTARFVPAFMLATFLKLMLCLAFMASYAMADKENAVPFILSFLALYMVFTTFEVAAILPVVRKAKE